jgi:glucose-6-phosphate isomerase
MPDLDTDNDRAARWKGFCDRFLRYPALGISLDYSRIKFDDGFFDALGPLCDSAFGDMDALERGDPVNTDENRMVGHYWLRNAELAPEPLRAGIEGAIVEAEAFSSAIHGGTVRAANNEPFRNLLCVGIGGSALGPQLLRHALVDHDAPLRTWFLDNTDPDGIARVLAEIGDGLPSTLTVVTSKSGGTPETRNGLLEVADAYKARGIDFSKHAVAVTGIGSQLDTKAANDGWLMRFPMEDWVGGRTSILSTVGLIPAALQGIAIRDLLKGAAAMDRRTREKDVFSNLSMLLALSWYSTGKGKGLKDMVILPYKDRLELFGRYLQQLIMESLGKELDRDGVQVHQGIAVYGNKGSTDQHAYVQQLRDGIDNFFATFIEVREAAKATGIEVDPGVTSGDYLQGFLRGTRAALWDGGRQSLTLSIPRVDARSMGALIAAFERAVSFYASLVNINAYHQPGVEAGKRAAADFIELMSQVRNGLKPGQATSASDLATSIGVEAESVFHILTHLAANDPKVSVKEGDGPESDRFTLSA